MSSRLKDTLKNCIDYFDLFFEAQGYKKKKKWNYVAPLADGFMKGISTEPIKLSGQLEFAPALTIQHDKVGKFVWTGLQRLRNTGTSNKQYQFSDTQLIAKTLQELVAFETDKTRRNGDYGFHEESGYQRACDTVCNDFLLVSDIFFREMDTTSKIIDILAKGSKFRLLPNPYHLLAVYYELGYFQEIEDFLEVYKTSEEKEDPFFSFVNEKLDLGPLTSSSFE